MKINNIPIQLRYLIPLVEEWGIEDDGYLGEKIEESTKEELVNLVNSISDNGFDELSEWLVTPELLKTPTAEYLKFSAFYLAYEIARVRSEKLLAANLSFFS
jgi:hypothetical protein